MKRREQERLLKESGFWLKREGSKHYIWTNGKETIAVSKGSKIAPNTLWSFKSRMRKAAST